MQSQWLYMLSHMNTEYMYTHTYMYAHICLDNRLVWVPATPPSPWSIHRQGSVSIRNETKHQHTFSVVKDSQGAKKQSFQHQKLHGDSPIIHRMHKCPQTQITTLVADLGFLRHAHCPRGLHNSQSKSVWCIIANS